MISVSRLLLRWSRLRGRCLDLQGRIAVLLRVSEIAKQDVRNSLRRESARHRTVERVRSRLWEVVATLGPTLVLVVTVVAITCAVAQLLYFLFGGFL